MKKTMLFTLILLASFSCCYYSDTSDDEWSIESEYGSDIYRKGNEKRVLIMGDSRGKRGLTWPWLPYTILNVSRGGETTEYTISRLNMIDEFDPDVVVVFSGINDRTKLSSTIFENNIDYIENYVTSRGIKLILVDILVNPLCYDAGFDPFRDYIAGSPYYLQTNHTPLWFEDTCHLSRIGYPALSVLLRAKIDE